MKENLSPYQNIKRVEVEITKTVVIYTTMGNDRAIENAIINYENILADSNSIHEVIKTESLIKESRFRKVSDVPTRAIIVGRDFNQPVHYVDGHEMPVYEAMGFIRCSSGLVANDSLVMMWDSKSNTFKSMNLKEFVEGKVSNINEPVDIHAKGFRFFSTTKELFQFLKFKKTLGD